MGRASKDKRDIYYRKAKEEGFRARSAYKLLQIHEEFNILNPSDITTGAVDLCAAPGSWSQVLSQHFKSIEEDKKSGSGPSSPEGDTDADASSSKPRIVAVDLQEMAPIDGVRLLQGDITSEATAREIIRLLNATDDEVSNSGTSDSAVGSSNNNSNSRKADIVVCDGAPDVTGMHELDEYLQHHLLLAALNITTFVLRPGGCFVTKMFRGPNTPFLVAKSELFFDEVRVVKPKSSRNASLESFLLCQGFRMPVGYAPQFLSASTAVEGGSTMQVSGLTSDAPDYRYAADSDNVNKKLLLPFLSCGDLTGFDADMCYNRDATQSVLAPVQPPLQAPYLNSGSNTEDGDQGVDKKRCKREA